MIPRRPLQTRYATTARRTQLARQAALAALIVIPGLACGTSDADVFRSADTAADGATASTASTGADTTAATDEAVGTTPAATAADPATDATDASPTTSEAAVATFPAGAELAVSFSFVPESNGGRVNNPYVAVWVEDPEGNLVQTISLWYEQSARGARWLADLPQWYRASGRAADVTMSGATRVAGDHTVVWDGTDLDGDPVAQGDYVLFVEAAREHGPYEITSTPITIGTDGFTLELPADGELADVTATFGG